MEAVGAQEVSDYMGAEPYPAPTEKWIRDGDGELEGSAICILAVKQVPTPPLNTELNSVLKYHMWL